MTIRRTSMACGLLLALGSLACGGSDDDEAKKKEIDRVEVQDSAFKPAGLEDTIDGLVEALGETQDETFDISVVLKNFGGYWEPVKVGANRAIAELDLTGQAESGLAEEDDPEDVVLAAQIDVVQQRIDDEYGGLGIAPHGVELTDVMDAAHDAGMPVVTIDSDLPDSKRDLYIGTNNSEAGTTGGETLAALIDQVVGASEGTVFVLGTTDEGWVDGHTRSMAAADALEAAGYTPIVDSIGWAQEDIDSDFAELPDMIANADPPTVGIIGMFSNAYRGAELAEMAGFAAGDIAIAAFDFEPDTLTYMESGYIQATHVQRQYYMGYVVPYAIYSIKVLGLDETRSLLGDHMIDSERFDTGVDVIEADQIDDYNDFLDSLGISG